MIFIWVYIILSIIGFATLHYLYDKKIVETFKIPNPVIYYILSFTWGLPLTCIGAVVALVNIVLGKKIKVLNSALWIETNTNFGLSLGLFLFAPEGIRTKYHEFGHSIQNAYLGIFMISIVAIPSVFRYWIRKIKIKVNKNCKLNSYDDVWFEGQATKTGMLIKDKRD